MNLDAIRERADRAAQTRGGEHVTWSLACIASAADVPTLLDEISNLRAALGEERAAHAEARKEIFTLTNSEDARLLFAEQERDEARASRDELARQRSAFEAQIRRLTDQLLMQSPNPGGMTIPGEASGA